MTEFRLFNVPEAALSHADWLANDRDFSRYRSVSKGVMFGGVMFGGAGLLNSLFYFVESSFDMAAFAKDGDADR